MTTVSERVKARKNGKKTPKKPATPVVTGSGRVLAPKKPATKKNSNKKINELVERIEKMERILTQNRILSLNYITKQLTNKDDEVSAYLKRVLILPDEPTIGQKKAKERVEKIIIYLLEFLRDELLL